MVNTGKFSRSGFRAAPLAAAMALGGCIAFADPADFTIVPASEAQIARERAAIEAYRADNWGRFDHDGDGALNRQEWRDKEWAFLLIYDADASGDIDLSEWIHSECGTFLSWEDMHRTCSRVALREFLSGTGRRDGRITQRHMRYNADRFFRMNDRNRDGVITRAEHLRE